MKKLLIFLSLFICIPQIYARCIADSCECAPGGKSYLATRPHFQSASPEMVSAFRYDFIHSGKDGIGGALQIVPLGSRSTRSSDLARYFMPFCNETVNVHEEDQDYPRNNLLAAHFNIFTKNSDFQSAVTIAPRQTVGGFGIQLRQDFAWNKKNNSGFWFSVSAPLIHVRNELNFCEKIINDGGGVDTDQDANAVANMTQAFMQSDWKYGKISCDALTETKIADIEIKLGMEWLQYDPCHLEGYISFLIPTGTRPTAEFIFEPVVGHGRHFGIGFGSTAGIQIYASADNNKRVNFEWAHHSHYLFKKTQKRSFDLKGKVWSRYIETYANQEQAALANANNDVNLATPGINIFTQDVEVTPGFAHNMNTALVLQADGFRGEVGYNLYCRQAECIQLTCPWEEGPALKHALGEGQTNDARDMTGNTKIEQDTPTTFANYDQSLIKEEDLDLSAAATPCLISNTVYGFLGYTWDQRVYPSLLGAGTSYEFSTSDNAVLNRWTVWGKIAFAY